MYIPLYGKKIFYLYKLVTLFSSRWKVVHLAYLLYMLLTLY